MDFFKDCKADAVAEIKPDVEGLEVYRLTAPSYIVKVTIDKQEYELWFGNTSAYSQTAVMLKGRDIVYLISSDTLSFTTASFDDVANTIMLMPYIDTLDTVTIDYNGQSYKFEVTGKSTDLAVTYNGKTLDAESFRSVYRNILAFKKEESADKPEGRPTLPSPSPIAEWKPRTSSPLPRLTREEAFMNSMERATSMCSIQRLIISSTLSQGLSMDRKSARPNKEIVKYQKKKFPFSFGQKMGKSRRNTAPAFSLL